MEFEWDQQKNLANYAKHKINFELASKVFEDPLAKFVAHTYRIREGQESTRIISARRATSHERRLYEEE